MDKSKFTFSGFLEAKRIDNENQPLPSGISDYMQRIVYPTVIPPQWKPEGEMTRNIYSNEGALIATGYMGIFLHDYGIYLKISEAQIVKKNVVQATGNSTDDAAANVTTYILYKSVDGSTNLRRQIRVVGAKSFTPNFYYVSVFDVATGDSLPTQHGLEGEKPVILCQPASCKGVYLDFTFGYANAAGTKIQRIYNKLCAKYDELGLLGNFQVGMLNEEKTLGIANLFCTRAIEEKNPLSGFNKKAFISALVELSGTAEDYRLLIPYQFGGVLSNAEWDSLIFTISCKLRGCDICIVDNNVPEQEAETEIPEEAFPEEIEEATAEIEEVESKEPNEPEKAEQPNEEDIATVSEESTEPEQEPEKKEEQPEAQNIAENDPKTKVINHMRHVFNEVEPAYEEPPVHEKTAIKSENKIKMNNRFTTAFQKRDAINARFSTNNPNAFDDEVRLNIQRVVRTANRKTLELIQQVLDLNEDDKEALFEAIEERNSQKGNKYE